MRLCLLNWLLNYFLRNILRLLFWYLIIKFKSFDNIWPGYITLTLLRLWFCHGLLRNLLLISIMMHSLLWILLRSSYSLSVLRRILNRLLLDELRSVLLLILIIWNSSWLLTFLMLLILTIRSDWSRLVKLRCCGIL